MDLARTLTLAPTLARTLTSTLTLAPTRPNLCTLTLTRFVDLGIADSTFALPILSGASALSLVTLSLTSNP